MKILITILIFISVSSAHGSDSLKLTKTFPKIDTKILTDTILDIRGTEIDTFGFIPDIIFVVRDLEGWVVPPQNDSPFLLVYGTDALFQRYGPIPRTSNAIQLNREYHSGKKYVIRYFDNYLRKEADTIDFRTLVEIDSLKGRTCIYEVQLGRDAWSSECIITTTKRFRKKEKELINQIFMNQDLYGVLESERGTRFYKEVKEKIDIPERKKRKIWCFCSSTPNSK